MRHANEAIEAAGGQVVLVGMGTEAQSQAFKARFEVSFPMVCDPDRNLYRDFAIERMSPLGFFSPTIALRGIAAMAQGHTMGLPEGDVRQLPGVFIIDRDGIIQYRHDGGDPADYPEPQELIEALGSF
ncbi:MAG: redoxin domain-containing protein [Desulfosarcina sp.]|nr:redoxin domain-containing protein [Desulfobacterales bacterium]